MNTWQWAVKAHHYTTTFYDLKVPLKCNWLVRMWNCLYYPDINGLDNAVIMEVLSWKIKFSVNGSILSRKSSPKFYFKKCMKNIMTRNLVKRCMACLFNKFVCFFLEQVPQIIKSHYQYNLSLVLQVTFNL